MVASVTHILPLTFIHRQRSLPLKGRVVVRKGQQVTPGDTVAEANLNPEHLLLDIARGLNLPAKEADQYIQYEAGDEVQEGDVVAGPVGVGRRVVRAPQPGVVLVAGGGHVLLEVESPAYELKAGFTGLVADLIPDQGIIIETSGALIQGVWGNNRVDYGLLNVKASTPDEILTVDKLDVSLRGSVVLAGYCKDAEVLNFANELPLRGLILGSMEPALIPTALKVGFPLILVEGFGKLPLNSIAYRLLSTSERREVNLNAEGWDRYARSRPEIIIPLPSDGRLNSPPEMDEFEPGQQVRVISPPYQAKVGALISLRPGLTTLANGLRVRAGEVRLETGETLVIPLANLEIVE